MKLSLIFLNSLLLAGTMALPAAAQSNPRAKYPAEPDGYGHRTFDLHIVNTETIPVSFEIGDVNCADSPRAGEVYGPVPPGGRVSLWIARVQGNDCDGRNGSFTVKAISEFAILEKQGFTFDNGGSIAMTNSTKETRGFMSGKNATDGSYTWIFDGLDDNEVKSGHNRYGNRTFDLYLVNSSNQPTVFTVTSDSCCDSPKAGQRYGPVDPGKAVGVWVARVQGNGCDGSNGSFSIVSSAFGEPQSFTFSNEGTIAMSNVPTSYDSFLSTKHENTSYAWTWMPHWVAALSTPKVRPNQKSHEFQVAVHGQMLPGESQIALMIRQQQADGTWKDIYTSQPQKVKSQAMGDKFRSTMAVPYHTLGIPRSGSTLAATAYIFQGNQVVAVSTPASFQY